MNMSKRAKRIVMTSLAVLLAVLITVPVLNGIVSAANDELSIIEKATVTDVTEGSRDVLYNTGGTVTSGGYDVYAEGNTMYLDTAVDQAKIDEWLAALRRAYYPYTPESLGSKGSMYFTRDYGTVAAGTEADVWAPVYDSGRIQLIDMGYYYLKNNNLSMKGFSETYLKADGSFTANGETVFKLMAAGTPVNGNEYNRFYLLSQDGTLVYCLNAASNGVVTISTDDVANIGSYDPLSMVSGDKVGSTAATAVKIGIYSPIEGGTGDTTLTDNYVYFRVNCDNNNKVINSLEVKNYAYASGNHQANWTFEPLYDFSPDDGTGFPKVTYLWSAGDHEVAATADPNRDEKTANLVADIADTGEIRIYNPGTVTFTCTATVDNGYTAADSADLGGLDIEKTFSVTYTFTEYLASTKENPLTDMSDTVNFPALNQPGSVTIAKDSDGTGTGYTVNGVTNIKLDVESLSDSEPIDVVLVIDTSRSMVDFYGYSAVFSEGVRNQYNADGEIITDADVSQNAEVITDVSFSGSRDVTFVLDKLDRDDSVKIVDYSDVSDPEDGVATVADTYGQKTLDLLATGEYYVPIYRFDDLQNSYDTAQPVYYCYLASGGIYTVCTLGDNPDTADVIETDYPTSTIATADALRDIVFTADGSSYYTETKTAADEFIMNYDKIDAARESAATFVNTLLDASPRSRIALVQFANDDTDSNGEFYSINSRVISGYTSDRETLLSLIRNNSYTDSDTRYAREGLGSGYYRYQPSAAEDAALNGNLASKGLTISNVGGTNYGLAFRKTEEVISLDTAVDPDGNSVAAERQMVIFMTDGEPNYLNLGSDSIFNGTNEWLNKIAGGARDSRSWSFFALRRELQAVNRIEELGYEIVTVGFDLDYEGTDYFADYGPLVNNGKVYKFDTNTATRDYETSLAEDLGLGDATGNVLVHLRKKVVENIATFADGYYAVEKGEDGTADYSTLNRAYEKIADSIFYSTSEAEVTDVVGSDFELRLLPYRNGYGTQVNPQIVVSAYDLSVNTDGTVTKAEGSDVVLETVTLTGSSLEGGITYNSSCTDEDGNAITGTITSENYTITGKYFTFTSADGVQTFNWTIGDIINQHFTLSYDAYLTGSDPVYEQAMNRADSAWQNGGSDVSFTADSGNTANDGDYATNESATILYKNYNNEYCRQTFAVPEEEWDTTSVTARKVWVTDSNGNEYNNRPASVTFQLLKRRVGETAYQPVYTVQAVAAENWSYTWYELPLHEDGIALEYSVEELNVPEAYISSGAVLTDGELVITNTLKTCDISVSKVWSDADNVAGFRPADGGVTVTLQRGAASEEDVVYTDVETRTVYGSYTWYNQPLYVNGQSVTYRVIESEIPTGYTASYETDTEENGDISCTITNTHTPEKVNFTVNKEWADNNDSEGFRPDSVTVKLYGHVDQTQVVEMTQSIESQEGSIWTHTWYDLPKHSGGQEIVYSVAEEFESEWYTSAEPTQNSDGSYTIVNSHETSEVSVTVAKIWDDENDYDGNRPTEITVRLLASVNGVNDESLSRVMTLNASDAVEGDASRWSDEWSGLPRYKDGTEIVYTVEELTDTGYYDYTAPVKNADGSFTITNVYKYCDVTVNYEDLSGEVIKDPAAPYVNADKGIRYDVVEMGCKYDVIESPEGKYVFVKVKDGSDEQSGLLDSNKVITYVYDLIEDPEITKSVSTDSVDITNGPGTVIYTVTVHNPNSYRITNVKVSDVIPAGLTYVAPESSSFSESFANGVVSWIIPEIAEGSSVDVTFTATVSADTTTYTYYNDAQVDEITVMPSGGTENITVPYDNDPIVSNEVATGVYKTPGIVKAVDRELVLITDDSSRYNLVYTLTVHNPNGYPLTNVKVSDAVPAGLTFVSATANGTEADGTVTWNIGSIAAGGNAEVSFTAYISDADSANGVRLGDTDPYENIAYVTEITYDPDGSAEDSFPATTVSVNVPSNEVSTYTYRNPRINKEASTELIYVQDDTGATAYSITYTLTVSNPNDFALTGVSVSDELHTGLTFVEASDGGELSEGSVIWDALTVPARNAETGADGIKTLTFTVRLSDTPVGSSAPYENIAVITGMTVDPDGDAQNGLPAEDKTVSIPSNEVVTNVYKDPEIVKEVDKNRANVGELVTYTLTVTNDGTMPLYNVMVTDILPAGMTFAANNSGVSVSMETDRTTAEFAGAEGVITTEGGVLTATIPCIDAGGTTVITFYVQISDASYITYTNEAVISRVYLDPDDTAPYVQNITSNEVVTDIISEPYIEKSVDKATAALGDKLTYTITVVNPTAEDITDAVITDTLPAGLATTDSHYDAETGILTWTGIDITSGQQHQIAFEATVTDVEIASVYHNIAYLKSVEIDVDGDGDDDHVDYTDKLAVADTKPLRYPTVVKSVDKIIVLIDDESEAYNLVYTLTVHNPNTYALTDVRVSDAVPAGLTFVSATANGTEADGTVTWNIASIAAGGNAEVSFTAYISDADSENGIRLGDTDPYENIAYVTEITYDPDGNAAGSVPAATETVSIPSNEVSTYTYREPTILKEADTDLIYITDETGATAYYINYTLTVKNSNDFVLTGVSVSDELHPGLQFISADNNGTLLPEGKVAWSNLTVPAKNAQTGEDGEKQITFTVKLADTDALGALALGSNAPYENTAVITGMTVDPDGDAENGIPAENKTVSIPSNEVVTDVCKDPTIVKGVDKTGASVGERVTYTLTVTNNGRVPLYDVVVTDEIPAGMAFTTNDEGNAVSVSTSIVPAEYDGIRGEAAVDGRNLTVNIPCIGAGGTTTITFCVQISDASFITYTNDAIIREAYLNPDDAENEEAEPFVENIESNEVVTKIISEPYIEKSVDRKAAVEGDVLTYTITVYNPTAELITNAVVTDTLPAGLTTTDSRYDEETGLLTFTLPPIASGSSARVTFTATVTDTEICDIYHNVAELESADTDIDADGDSDHVEYTDKIATADTYPLNDPYIVKSDDKVYVEEGDEITYTLTVYNPNSYDLLNVEVRDPLPAGVTYVPAEGAPAAGEGGTLRFTVDWIAAAQNGIPGSYTITFKVRVTDRDEAIFLNTGYIDGAVIDVNGDGAVPEGSEAFNGSNDLVLTYNTNPNSEADDNVSNTVDADVLFNLTVEYREYDSTAANNHGDKLDEDYSSPGNRRGDEYDVTEIEPGILPEIIITDNDEIWVLKEISENADSPDGVFDGDKTVVVLYEKYDSLYTVRKQVTATPDVEESWTDELEVLPGTQVYFRIIVENLTAYEITEIDLTDNLVLNTGIGYLPDNWTSIIEAFPDGLTKNQKWISPNMALTAAGTAGDIYVNTATVSNEDESIPDLSDDAMVRLVAPGALELTKSANVAPDENGSKFVAAGGRVSFTITVTNTGGSVLKNVVVTDDHDVIVVGENNSETRCAANTPIDTIATLGVGDSKSYNVYIEVSDAAYDGQVITNTATAAGEDKDGNEIPEATDDDTVIVSIPEPVLTIVKKVNNTDARENPLAVAPGQTLTYTVTVINTSEVDAFDVYVADHMHVNGEKLTEEWAIDKGWTIDVPAGESVTIEDEVFVMEMPAGQAGTVLNNVALLYTDEDAFTNGEDPIAEDIAMVETDAVYDIEVVKVAEVATADPGDTVEYVITVTNKSNADLTDILVTDSLDGDWGRLPTRTAEGEQVSVEKNRDNTLTIDSLKSGDSVRFSFEYEIADDSKEDAVTNTVTVESETPDGEIDDSSEAVVTVFQNSLTVVKTATVDTATAGSTVQFIITVTNTGKNELTNVIVTDSLDVTVIGEGSVDAEGNVTDSDEPSAANLEELGIDADDYDETVIGYFETLAAGEGKSILVSYTVPSDAKDGDVIENIATASADDGHEDSDDDSIEIVENKVYTYRMNVVKTANVAVADPGDTVTYTIAVTNTGDAELTNVTISDSLAVIYDGKSCPANQVLTTIPKLAPNETKTITVTYPISSNQTSKTLANTATADSDQTGAVESTVTITIAQPGISVTKSTNSQQVVAGTKVYYTLTVTNTGNVKLKDLLVEDTKIGYSYKIAELDVGKSWTSPYGDLYYTFGAQTAVGASFTNNVNVSNEEVKGATANTTTTVVENNNNYSGPNTGDSMFTSQPEKETNAWTVAASSAILCTLATVLIIRRRRSKKAC